MATNGCFVDAQPVTGRSKRPAASGKTDRRLWVDCRPPRPTADRQSILWLWFSETALTWPAAIRRTAGARGRSGYTRFGSASACQARDLTAVKLTFRLLDREPDVRGGQWTTHS